MKRIGWVFVYTFLLAGWAHGQRVWEGTASVARYGEFPPSGMYGASNSFDRNSIVEVENLETGKKVRLVITGKLADPTLFLVVSEEAGAELGMERSTIARVRVTPVVASGLVPIVPPIEPPTSPDPDINPAARVAASPDRAAPLPPLVEEMKPVETVSLPEPATEPAAPSETLPWKEPATENPWKDMESSFAKRDKPVFSGAEIFIVSEPEKESGEPLISEKPEEAAISEKPEEVAISEPPVVSEPSTESLSTAPPEEEVEMQEVIQLSLEPVEMRPPEEELKELDTILAETPLPSSHSPVAEKSSLKRGAYYLQIGSFVRAQSAQRLVEQFGHQYPIVVIQEEGQNLKVLVGPLNADEKGIIYHKFRSLGFKDAFFVRKD
jgi:cell division septation protein DedD